MNTPWLFPHGYRLIGWLLFVPSAMLGLASMYAGCRVDFLTISVNSPKPDSKQWAVYISYIVLGVLLLLVYGSLFLNVMIYTMFTVLLMFIIRFRLSIRRNERTVLMVL